LNKIQFIESKGFRIKGRYIYKPNSNKVIGQLNENNFYFFNENCYPFKSGVNFFDNKTLVDVNYIKYIREVKENEVNEFGIDYVDYAELTSETSTLQKVLEKFTLEWLDKKPINYYDVRGILKGSFRNASCFPVIDYNNNFVTAQIIKYGANGKRLKSGFSTTWLHSHKETKKQLDIKDKISLSIKSFFGEQTLNGSNNVVAIVEAPKTAVFLKELFPDIDFIATMGESAIKRKNLNVLRGRKVVLFPDAHSKVWFEFAKEQGFYASTILEHEDVQEGDDILDVFTDYGTNSVLKDNLIEHLTQIADGRILWQDNYDWQDLGFRQVRESNSYFPMFSPYYKNTPLNLSIDNSKDFRAIYRDANFVIFEKELFEDNSFKGFEVYSAQVDFHRQIKVKEGGFRFMTEKEFILALQGSFRILKELNPEIYKKAFKHYLMRFKTSNFRFNIDYVKDVLIEHWDKSDRDLSTFKKTRNWKYVGTEQLGRDEFIREKYNSEYKAKLKLRLEAFNDALAENRFIDLGTDLGIDSKAEGNLTLKKLVSQWNENVIGCKTLKSYINKELFESGTKNTTAHISSNIYTVVKNVPTKLSYSKITEITGITNKKTIKHLLEFKPDEKLAENIKDKLFYILENIQDAVPIRKDSRIVDFKIEIKESKTDKMLKYNQFTEDVFKPLEELETVNTDKHTLKQKQVLKDEIKYLKLINETSKYDEEEIQIQLENPPNRMELISTYFS